MQSAAWLALTQLMEVRILRSQRCRTSRDVCWCTASSCKPRGRVRLPYVPRFKPARVAQLVGGAALRTRAVQVRILFRVRSTWCRSSVVEHRLVTPTVAGSSPVDAAQHPVGGWPRGLRRRPAKAFRLRPARVRIPPLPLHLAPSSARLCSSVERAPGYEPGGRTFDSSQGYAPRAFGYG